MQSHDEKTIQSKFHEENVQTYFKNNYGESYKSRMPDHIKQKLAQREEERKSNWSRKKRSRKNSPKELNYRDRKTQLELRKKRMNYRRVKRSLSKENKNPNEDNSEKFERFYKSYFTPKYENNDVDYNSKEYKMKLFKKRMNYRTSRTPKKIIEKKSEVKKPKEDIKTTTKVDFKMAPESADFDSLVKAAFVHPKFFDSVLNNPGNLVQEFTKIFQKIDQKDQLLKKLIVQKLINFYKIEGKTQLIGEIENIADRIVKTEEKLNQIKSDKKSPCSLFKRTKASKMKLIEISIKSFLKKMIKEADPFADIKNDKDINAKKIEFMSIISNTTTEFNDFYYQSDKTVIIQKYLDEQIEKEIQRENSDSKEDLREVFNNCPKTELISIFSDSYIQNSISKILVQGSSGYEKYEPCVTEAWSALINFSKFLGLEENTKLGSLFRKRETINFAVITAWVLELKKIYLDLFYKENEKTWSLENWKKIMKGEMELAKKILPFWKEFFDKNNHLVQKEISEAYRDTIKTNPGIFFYIDSESNSFLDAIVGKYKYINFYLVDKIDKEKFVDNFLECVKTLDPVTTFKFMIKMMDNGLKYSIGKIFFEKF